MDAPDSVSRVCSWPRSGARKVFDRKGKTTSERLRKSSAGRFSTRVASALRFCRIHTITCRLLRCLLRRFSFDAGATAWTRLPDFLFGDKKSPEFVSPSVLKRQRSSHSRSSTKCIPVIMPEPVLAAISFTK